MAVDDLTPRSEDTNSHGTTSTHAALPPISPIIIEPPENDDSDDDIAALVAPLRRGRRPDDEERRRQRIMDFGGANTSTFRPASRHSRFIRHDEMDLFDHEQQDSRHRPAERVGTFSLLRTTVEPVSRADSGGFQRLLDSPSPSSQQLSVNDLDSLLPLTPSRPPGGTGEEGEDVTGSEVRSTILRTRLREMIAHLQELREVTASMQLQPMQPLHQARPMEMVPLLEETRARESGDNNAADEIAVRGHGVIFDPAQPDNRVDFGQHTFAEHHHPNAVDGNSEGEIVEVVEETVTMDMDTNDAYLPRIRRAINVSSNIDSREQVLQACPVLDEDGNEVDIEYLYSEPHRSAEHQPAERIFLRRRDRVGIRRATDHTAEDMLHDEQPWIVESTHPHVDDDGVMMATRRARSSSPVDRIQTGRSHNLASRADRLRRAVAADARNLLNENDATYNDDEDDGDVSDARTLVMENDDVTGVIEDVLLAGGEPHADYRDLGMGKVEVWLREARDMPWVEFVGR